MAWTDKRPMSPHLQIYKLPLTALISICHRMTGAINFVGIVLLVLVLARAAGGESSFAFASSLLSSWFGYLVLFGFTFALYFHFCNGIRHLFWDVGVGLDLESAKKTAPAVPIAAAVLTIVTWIVAIAA